MPESPTDGLPVWAKVIGFIGFPAAAASFVIWNLVSNYSVEQKVQTQILIELKTLTGAVTKQIESDGASARSGLNTLRLILSADCINQAVGPKEQGRCLGSEPLVDPQ